MIRRVIAILGVLVVVLMSQVGLSAREALRQTRAEYVEKYKLIAIKHMEQYGIPASITMAQGILESDSGNSVLSKKSNNHFGIKCKTGWTGRSVSYDDDAPGECFRAYDTVEESYHDHAEFLDSGERYDSLFRHSNTDYKRWARGLKGAGYATAPHYADMLIKIIEDEKLFLLDYQGGAQMYAQRDNYSLDTFNGESISTNREDEQSLSQTTTEVVDPDNHHANIDSRNGYNIYQINSVSYIEAKGGEDIKAIAKSFGLWSIRLRHYNDLDRGVTLVRGERIYLEGKSRTWDGREKYHISKQGETLTSLSILYGVKRRTLCKLNRGVDDNESLREGKVVKLRRGKDY